MTQPTPPTLVIGARCNCPPGPGGVERGLPIRVYEEAVEFFRALAAEREIPPDMTVGTYRCTRCKTVVILTARALHLSG